MTTNGRIENVKKIGKQMQRACPVELGLAHARTALARALGFENWYQLTKCLSKEFSGEFRTRAMAISPDPTDPTFSAAVRRFAESSSIDQSIAHSLCVEFLPQALEKWRTWKDRRSELEEPPKFKIGVWERPLEQKLGRKERVEDRPLLASSAGHTGGQLIPQGQRVEVVVRKKRRIFQSDNYLGALKP